MLNRLVKYVLFLTAALFLSFPTFDPDLGWHIAYGDYFWQNRALLTRDIFSWTLPNYEWYSLSWPYDLMVSLAFPKVGFEGLTLIGTLVLILTFYLLLKSFKVPFFWQVLALYVFVFFTQPVASSGFRPQLFVLLFLALAMYLIFRFEKGDRSALYLFPLVMFLWVNMHGSFIIGLFLIGIYLLSKNWRLLPFFLPLAGVTLLNPFGPEVYRQVLSYAPLLRTAGVNEWQPELIFSDKWLVLFVWTVFSLYLVWQNRRKQFGLFQAVTVFFFSYLAFNSRRMIAPFIVVSLPFALSFIEKKRLNLSKEADILIVFMVIAAFINGLLVRLPALNFHRINMEQYCESGLHCSKTAMDFVKKNPLPLRSLTFYNWGGYLIWQTKQKVFADGRMDQWQKNAYRAFSDHEKILQKNDLALFEKYNFEAVFIPATFRLAAYLEKKARAGEWQKVFNDERVVIFIKKNL